MINFPSIAFQSSLSMEGILFGVFGLLYSVYSLYSSNVTETELERPPVVARLRQVCQVIVALISINAIITIYSLVLLKPSHFSDIFLAAGFAIILLTMIIISAYWAFRVME